MFETSKVTLIRFFTFKVKFGHLFIWRIVYLLFLKFSVWVFVAYKFWSTINILQNESTQKNNNYDSITLFFGFLIIPFKFKDNLNWKWKQTRLYWFFFSKSACVNISRMILVCFSNPLSLRILRLFENQAVILKFFK